MSHGVDFPAAPDGTRSTTATGRAVIADALRATDPVGARAAENETAWRSRYLLHLRRAVEAGIDTPGAWWSIADGGLASVHERLVLTGGPDEVPATTLLTAPADRALGSVEVTGRGTAVGELALPYHGRTLRGNELRDRLATWAEEGILEPSAVRAVGDVIDHPEWLRLDGFTTVVLGAGAEMGPVGPLLGWGARVAAVDLPGPAMWHRLLKLAESSAGTLVLPTGSVDGDPPGSAGGDPAAAAGVDLLVQVPAIADWLAGLDGRLILGNYLYADGGAHVRLSVAADLLGRRLTDARPDSGLAFLATPTDVFVVPRDAVQQSGAAYAGRSGRAKAVGRPLRWLTRGRLVHRAYPPDADPGIADALVPAQGPNYALAKRIQRWRAAAARRDGRLVTFHVAPSTRTRSVMKNRALAAAYAGARRFGVEIFQPDTANTLMAALLVRDLAGGVTPHPHPWQDEAHAAVHGGLWRSAYEPRSMLGLAAVLGYAASRR